MKISVFKDQKKEFICRGALIASDLFWLNVSLGLSFLTVMFFIGDLNTFMPILQIDVRVLSHFILTVMCVFGLASAYVIMHKRNPSGLNLKKHCVLLSSFRSSILH